MSKHGPCDNIYSTCGPQAIAIIVCQDGDELRMCKRCLDDWFDSADDAPYLEPAALRWLSVPTEPSHEDWHAALRDPRNHEIVSSALRREARHGAQWLREFIRRENRIGSLAPR